MSGSAEEYRVIVLLDVNETQDVDDRAEARTYLVADRQSGKAAIIDSVIENVARDCAVLRQLNLTLCFAMETHVHADHITGASALKDSTGAQIVYGGAAKGVVGGVDLFLPDGAELSIGKTSIRSLGTPGHTAICASYVVPGAVFTGDSLFIGSNGRTDLQGGSAETLFDSIRRILFALPDDTIVYPGHDYHGRVSSTIGEEKQFNERLNCSVGRDAFVNIMKGRNVPPPAKMDLAVAANLRAGRISAK